MCLKLLRSRMTHKQKERPKSGKWMVLAQNNKETINVDDNMIKSNYESINGFNVSKLANICMPEIIENYDYFTNGKSEAGFEQWQSKYTFLKKIGEGSYANVKMAMHKDLNHKVAIKIYDKKSL